MRADRKWVERNLGFDPIAKPPPLATFAFKAAAKAATSRRFPARDHRFRFRIHGRPAVPGLHHRDRAVALHRCSLAEEAGAQDGPEAARRRQRPAAARRCAPGHMDRGRRPCAEPRADPRQGFPATTISPTPIISRRSPRRCARAARRSRRSASAPIGRRASAENRSSSSSRTRICRRTVRSCPTSTCGARSSRKCSPSS